MASIAIFTTYAPSEGFGGPARTYHQRRVLEAAGHQVDHVVVQADAGRGDTRATDLVILCERPHGAPVDHVYADVDLGRRAAADASVVERVRRYLDRRGTELVILEQPFLVELAELAASSTSPRFVYSSQNIEYRLRRDLERFVPRSGPDRGRSSEVRDLEVRAVEISAAVTAICATDQRLMRDEFDCATTIVPNGSTIADLELRSARRPAEPTFVFAGSSYWPNIEGFVQVATPSLAFLPPTSRIHLAGTAGREIVRNPNILRRESVNRSRLVERGFLPMTELASLMRSATAVLVPVFIGEGSNLKSADALACGAPVVMTERATRGYESVIDADDGAITVVDEPADFRAAMRSLSSSVGVPGSDIGERRRRLLSWPARLEPLLDLVQQLIATDRRV